MLLHVQTRRIEPDVFVVEFAGKFTLESAEGQGIDTLLNDVLQQDQKKFIFDLMRLPTTWTHGGTNLLNSIANV